MNVYRHILYSLITLFLLSSAISLPINDVKDPCVPLIGNSNPKYVDVKNCLTSFPYDKHRAKETIETLKLITQDYYVLYYQAKEPPQPGFTFDPIDLSKELDQILAIDYETDFDFMTDIRKLYIKLHDGHTQFIASCYTNLEFSQQLQLYSMVKNEKQIIKVFNDSVDPTNVDCEVTLIDSVPATEAIRKFAFNNSHISRDLGVRFNNALTSLYFTFVGEIIPFKYGSEFTSRVDLPETDSIEYTLNCPNNKQKTLKREWLVSSSFTKGFNDSHSFFKNNCLQKSAKSTHAEPITNLQKTLPYRHVKPEANSFTSKTSISSLSQAVLVYDTLVGTRFYQSHDGDVGIVVIPNAPPADEFTVQALKKGLQTLADKGPKKIVIDLSNNEGGYIEFVPLINSIFAPSEHNIFPDDVSVESSIVRQVITASVGTDNFIDPTINTTIDYLTEKPFKSASEFVGSNKYKRGGNFYRYSSKHIFKYEDIEPPKSPWDSKSTIILTNGICGSSCALIAEHLNEVGQICTVAVGGFYGEELSFSSFTGGNNVASDSLLNGLSDLNINYIQPFEYQNAFLYFTFREAYSIKDPDVVLDFDFRPADFRLYYDEKNVRDPSILWIEAAKFLDTN